MLAATAAVEGYESALFEVLLDGLAALEHVELVGSPARGAATACFTVAGRPSTEVAEYCARAHVNVWAGHIYAWELTGCWASVSEGPARAGLVHYNDRSDVDRLLDALADLA